MRFEDPYEILGLKPEASDDEVKAAYEKLLNEEDKKEEAQAAYSQICEMKAEKPAEEAPAEKTEEEPAAEAPAEKAEEEQPQQEPAKEAAEEKKKATPGQMALGVLAIVALAAVLVALIMAAMGGKEAPSEVLEETSQSAPAAGEEAVPAETAEATIPADGDPNNETCKGSYTASDEEVIATADTVVASMADYQLTNAQLQIYYWMGIQGMMQENPYIAYMGVDVSKPLDSQPCALAPGQSWQQFFLKQALISWQNYQAMAAEAELAGREMDDDLKEFLENLPGEMEKQAKEAGFADAKAMLANNVGAGAEIEDYLHFMKIYNLGYGYFVDALDKAAPTDEQIEKYMAEHEAELLEGGINKDNKVASVRHILISPEDTESEESWAEAEKKAQEILDAYLAGEQTEENFGKLAGEHTMDPGSQTTGGLYEDFAQGQMVAPFDQWSFDAVRKAGDTGIVKTDYGYHIMYFVATRPVWQEQVSQVIMKENADKLISDSAAKYPMDVDYSSIVIGELKAQ